MYKSFISLNKTFIQNVKFLLIDLSFIKDLRCKVKVLCNDINDLYMDKRYWETFNMHIHE